MAPAQEPTSRANKTKTSIHIIRQHVCKSENAFRIYVCIYMPERSPLPRINGDYNNTRILKLLILMDMFNTVCTKEN